MRSASAHSASTASRPSSGSVPACARRPVACSSSQRPPLRARPRPPFPGPTALQHQGGVRSRPRRPASRRGRSAAPRRAPRTSSSVPTVLGGTQLGCPSTRRRAGRPSCPRRQARARGRPRRRTAAPPRCRWGRRCRGGRPARRGCVRCRASRRVDVQAGLARHELGLPAESRQPRRERVREGVERRRVLARGVVRVDPGREVGEQLVEGARPPRRARPARGPRRCRRRALGGSEERQDRGVELVRVLPQAGVTARLRPGRARQLLVQPARQLRGDDQVALADQGQAPGRSPRPGDRGCRAS